VGYFSNGSEGDSYRAQFCDKCANDGDEKDDTGCAVFDAHLLYNYEQHKDEGVRKVLNTLIPREGIWNAQCRMFRAKAEAVHAD
jgi:hypothetical protein